jgi:hypothetical protein
MKYCCIEVIKQGFAVSHAACKQYFRPCSLTHCNTHIQHCRTKEAYFPVREKALPETGSEWHCNW